jgi:hypothetical protein
LNFCLGGQKGEKIPFAREKITKIKKKSRSKCDNLCDHMMYDRERDLDRERDRAAAAASIYQKFA